MSYDYNQLVEQIEQSRARIPQTPTEVEETLNCFTNLSTKCPMTPLLWMQYAFDAGRVLKLLEQEGSLDITCQILELGLEEFPSCAMLRLFHFDCIVTKYFTSSDDDGMSGDVGGSNGKDKEEVQRVWNDILHSVCLGCHGGSDEQIILAIFNIYAQYLLKNMPSDLGQLFSHRATLFMKSGNDSIRSEMDAFSEKFGIIFADSDYDKVEYNWQFSSQHFRFLSNLEDEVLIAMESDGIASPPDLDSFYLEGNEEVSNQTPSSTYDWEKLVIEMGRKKSYLMGYGMIHTSKAFNKYTKAIIQQIKQLQKRVAGGKSDDDERNSELIKVLEDMKKMIIGTFERSVSECPTVGIVWGSYIKHLLFIVNDNSGKKDALEIAQALDLAKSVVQRGVRNCPYSVDLFSLKMKILQNEVKLGRAILDPEQLTSIVNDAIEGQFLPTGESHLDVYFSAFSIMKQLILELVSKDSCNVPFDEAENVIVSQGKKRKREESTAPTVKMYNTVLKNEAIIQEVQDLIDDSREMYEEADAFIRKKFNDVPYLRETLLREKAITEGYVFLPILSHSNYLEKAIDHFETIFRTCQSPHPESWRCYINFVMGNNSWDKFSNTNSSSVDDEDFLTGGTAAKIRFIRSLYHRCMVSSKKEKKIGSQNMDATFIYAQRTLCNDFLIFERNYGSEKSQASAKKMVDAKLCLIIGRQSHDIIHEAEMQTNQQELRNTDGKPLVKTTEEARSEPTEKSTNLSIKDDVPKIMIGNLQYPAHPFTIHVSNLSPKTEDMELYDLFLKCGKIVHCRIFREHNKHTHGQLPHSKCAGLIQFEERDSVEEALKLNGEIGLHEKLMKVHRSHQPAVAIVPPGMHRIQPKGQGKSTKRNAKRKDRRMKQEEKSNSPVAAVANESISTGASKKEEERRSANEKPQMEVNKSEMNASEKVITSSTTTAGNGTSILAFRPRGVVRKKRKAKISITTNEKK